MMSNSVILLYLGSKHNNSLGSEVQRRGIWGSVSPDLDVNVCQEACQNSSSAVC